MTSLKSQPKPKWQLYDLVNNPEHDLFDSFVVEFTDISGIKVNYYILNTDTIDMDTLYGEATNLSYGSAKVTKVIYEPTAEPTIYKSFGLVSDENIQFALIPKTTFSRDVSSSIEPKPGDIIQTLWNSRTYEVTDVGSEAHIFQLSKMIWELILKPYRYSEQSDSAKSLLQSPDSTLSDPLSAYGDNEFIEDQSDDIDTYSDTDTSIYGY